MYHFPLDTFFTLFLARYTFCYFVFQYVCVCVCVCVGVCVGVCGGRAVVVMTVQTEAKGEKECLFPPLKGIRLNACGDNGSEAVTSSRSHRIKSNHELY